VTGALTLRDAVPGDEVAICGFVRALAEYEKMAGEAHGTAEDFRRALFGTPPRAFALLAEVAEEAVGFAVWFFNFSTFAARPGLYVEDVFVLPAWRGKGIGRAIFRDLARRALAAGCARMDWQVLDWNAPAIGFYRSIGAHALDEWTTQRLEGEALHRFAALAGGRGDGPSQSPRAGEKRKDPQEWPTKASI
jgi:GNAT superfamily N-acetyltransferase